MRREIFDYFNIAGRLTSKRKDGRAFLIGAVAVRDDGTMVSAINSASEYPNRLLHSEYKIAKKCDVGAVVYVARVRLLNGQFAMSKPCHNCEKVLKCRGISRIFYSIDHLGSYGVIKFDRGKKVDEYQVIKQAI